VLNEHIGEDRQCLTAFDNASALSEQLELFITGRGQSVHSFFSFIQNRSDSKGWPALWIRQKALKACGLESNSGLWKSGHVEKDGLEQLEHRCVKRRLVQKLSTCCATTCSFELF
jgi:hypothetical protein